MSLSGTYKEYVSAKMATHEMVVLLVYYLITLSDVVTMKSFGELRTERGRKSLSFILYPFAFDMSDILQVFVRSCSLFVNGVSDVVDKMTN